MRPPSAAMRSADRSSNSRSSRIRRREGDEDQPDAEPSQLQSAAHTATDAATGAIRAQAAAAATQLKSSGVQPLSEQFSQRKKPRRSPRLVCHLDKLVTVELQLVLQWLDTRSRLVAARCSRRLLRAASSPFAWRDASLLAVSLSRLAAAPPCSPLLRLNPISLRLDDSDESSGLMRNPLPRGIAVRELHLRRVRWRYDAPTSSLLPLLQSPALQSLQLLSAPDTRVLPAALQFLAQLPHLHSLSIYCYSGCDLSPLAAAPALTHLDFILPWSTERCARQVGQCIHLRSLRLASQPGSMPGCRELFTVAPSPQQRIERLELEGFTVRYDPGRSHFPAPTAEEMVAGLSVMRHLTHLRLTRIYDIDALLACLHAAPSLRVLELDLEPQSPHVISFSGSTHPTAGAVCALLDRMPGLEVRLLFAPSVDEWLARADGQEVVDFRAEFVEQWNQLQHDFSDIPRVSIVAPAPAET